MASNSQIIENHMALAQDTGSIPEKQNLFYPQNLFCWFLFNMMNLIFQSSLKFVHDNHVSDIHHTKIPDGSQHKNVTSSAEQRDFCATTLQSAIAKAERATSS